MSVFENINTLHPKMQGSLGEAAAIFHLTKMGFVLYKPLCDAGKADFIIEDTDGKLSRVQVKTTTQQVKHKTKWYIVNLVTTGGNRKINTRCLKQIGDYDYLFVLASNGECWFIPERAMNGATTGIVLGLPYVEYKIV